MSYTLEKTPRVVDFALNPFGFELDSPRVKGARFWIIFDSAPGVGTYIEINWGNKSIRYDFVTQADESGTQITASTALDDDIMHSELIKNTLFNATWERWFGPYYYEKNITDFLPVEIKSTSPSVIPHYSDIKFQDPLKIVSELFVKHNGDSGFISKGFAFHPIDYLGKASINLKNRIVEGFNPYLPLVGKSSFELINITEYYLKLWEHHPNNGVSLVDEVTTSHYFAIFARLPYRIFPTFTIPLPLLILSNAHSWREIWKDAHQELTILITSDIASFDVKAKLYFTDETDETIDIETIACAQNESYFIPAGYNQLDIDANTPDGKECYRYEILIVYESVTICSASFIVVEKPDYGKVFRFLNAFGGYDAICIKGMENKKLKTNVVEAETSIPLSYNATDAAYQKRSLNPYEGFELILGSLTKQELNHLKEIVDSPFVWKLENDEFIPIVITSDEFDLGDELEDLSSPKLTYRYAFPC